MDTFGTLCVRCGEVVHDCLALRYSEEFVQSIVDVTKRFGEARQM